MESVQQEGRPLHLLRRVMRSILMAEGPANMIHLGVHHFRRDKLECGHTVEIGWGRSLKERKFRRCDECRTPNISPHGKVGIKGYAQED